MIISPWFNTYFTISIYKKDIKKQKPGLKKSELNY